MSLDCCLLALLTVKCYVWQAGIESLHILVKQSSGTNVPFKVCQLVGCLRNDEMMIVVYPACHWPHLLKRNRSKSKYYSEILQQRNW